MNKKNKGKIEKILSVVMVLVAVVLGVLLFRESSQQNREEQQVVSQMQEQSQKMNTEIRAVQQEIYDKELELDEIQKTPYVFLCFSGNDSQMCIRDSLFIFRSQRDREIHPCQPVGPLPGPGPGTYYQRRQTRCLYRRGAMFCLRHPFQWKNRFK